jgi:nitrite reductase/ring-hydroxylating ferredoxin subunit
VTRTALFDVGAEDALGLGVSTPGDWYRSEGVLAAEQRSLFARSWALMGTAEELAEPGSFVTATIGGSPIVVVRGRDHHLRAFHNVCRHRGITLLEGTGATGRFITCPYHQWSFELDGALARVPQEAEEFPGLDRATLGLHPAAVAEWAGMVLARPALDGPSLTEAMAGLDERLAPFSKEETVEVARVQYEAPCNWKFLVENHVDVYHLWYLHQHSLNRYRHSDFAWASCGDNWWSLEPLKDPAETPSGLGWLPEAERGGIGAYLLFPNLMMVSTGDYFATYDASPLSALVEAIRSFMAEDIECCRRLQAATHSPAFELGPLSEHHEEPIRRFHAALCRYLFG